MFSTGTDISLIDDNDDGDHHHHRDDDDDDDNYVVDVAIAVRVLFTKRDGFLCLFICLVVVVVVGGGGGGVGRGRRGRGLLTRSPVLNSSAPSVVIV